MKITIFLFAGLIAFKLSGQTPPRQAFLESDDWEVWQKNVPVSGGVRVGLMLQAEPGPLQPSRFFVNIPETGTKNLCIELSSKDGRYSAKLNYDITGLSTGMNEFLLPTRYGEELSAYQENEVVILASLGESCKEKPQNYLLSGWVKTDEMKTAVLYINSPGETFLLVDESEGKGKEIPFERVDTPTVAFNKKCTLRLDELNEEAKLFIIQRVRKMGRVRINRYEVPLKYAVF